MTPLTGVKVSDSDNLKTYLPVEEFQNLWKLKFDDSDHILHSRYSAAGVRPELMMGVLGTVRWVQPEIPPVWSGQRDYLPLDLLPYIRTLVSSLKNEEVAELCSQITHGLPKALSKVMNDLSVKVNIADSDSPEDSPRDSLTGILLKVLNYKQCGFSSNSQVNHHKLSVVVEVHKLDIMIFCLISDTINDVQALVALAIVLKCYPESWRQKFFWDAWLAITMQLCLSGGFRGKLTFPCVWMKQAFDIERLVSPEHVQHLLFGKDRLVRLNGTVKIGYAKLLVLLFMELGMMTLLLKG